MSEENEKINNGEKIDSKYQDPVDNILISLSDKLSPLFKSMNFTPNGITMISTILSLAALYYLYQKNVLNFSIFFALAYFFDVMDGHYARKYNMMTENGDKFDHYKDIFFGVAIIVILFMQYDMLSFPILIVIMIALYALTLTYLGCVETITSSENRSKTLSFTNDIASKVVEMDKTSCENRMPRLRWFGPGIFMLFLLVAIAYIDGNQDTLSSIFTNGNIGLNSDQVPGTEEIKKIFSNEPMFGGNSGNSGNSRNIGNMFNNIVNSSSMSPIDYSTDIGMSYLDVSDDGIFSKLKKLGSYLFSQNPLTSSSITLSSIADTTA